MTVHPLRHTRQADPVAEARIQLAAALRMAVLDELEEGIDNHFTVQVPGRHGQYLILLFGHHWSEARASDMMVFDESGSTLEGQGVVELSAQCIHAPLHRLTGAQVVLHTHQHWAMALNMLQDNRLLPASQTAALLVEVAGGGPLEEVRGLGPNDPVDPWVVDVEARAADLALVGHLPFMGILAQELLGAAARFDQVRFVTAGVLVLERQADGTWSVIGQLAPD